MKSCAVGNSRRVPAGQWPDGRMWWIQAQQPSTDGAALPGSELGDGVRREKGCECRVLGLCRQREEEE